MMCSQRNKISEIKGLDTLVNLEELDLSYNVITEIDLIKRYDKDLDDEQAEDRLIKNKALNQQNTRANRFKQIGEENEFNKNPFW